MKDEDIRAARSAAHAGEDSLVPLGEEDPSTEEHPSTNRSVRLSQTKDLPLMAGTTTLSGKKRGLQLHTSRRH
jgi:hypothetical protein